MCVVWVVAWRDSPCPHPHPHYHLPLSSIVSLPLECSVPGRDRPHTHTHTLATPLPLGSETHACTLVQWGGYHSLEDGTLRTRGPLPAAHTFE